MKEVLNIYKKIGETPLEALERFRKKNPDYRDIPITYAGRLDPIAEGVLILLAGEGVHKKDEYLGLDKEYGGEILIGFKSDTFDILGFPAYRQTGASNFDQNNSEGIEDQPSLPPSHEATEGRRKLRRIKGDFEFSLPPFSSYKIQGKPLFWWAREGRLSEIDIPKRTTQIYNLEILSDYEIESKDLLGQILEKIDLVKGDFRQEEIKKRWTKLLTKEKSFKILKIRVNCSSGTYVRSIADKVGGCLFSLKRTRVGEFDIKKSMIT